MKFIFSYQGHFNIKTIMPYILLCNNNEFQKAEQTRFSFSLRMREIIS